MQLNEFKTYEAGEESVGFIIHLFLQHFDQTFNKSSYKRFLKFFENNQHINKWMIFSDYVIGEKSKPNDVVTFSIIPYNKNFHTRGEIIEKKSFKDAKKLKRINSDFINLLSDDEILNLSILVPKKWKLDPINERELLRTRYTSAIKQVDHWLTHGPNRSYDILKRNLNILLAELDKQGANLTAIRNIEFVSTMSAYISYQVCLATKVDIVGWFSDRDSMLSYKAAKFDKPVIFDLSHNLFHVLMMSNNPDYSEKLVFGLPETTGKVWYDSYNRVPDLIAATLADYDYINNKCSEKFVPVIEKVLINKDKQIIYRLSYENSQHQTSVLDFGLEEECINSDD
ncbi:hypothetical protein [Vibrio kanaloae]|uniref:hypothetical protein n=1 Tax=Vibrio kanaloae TaxID=170673 RepID=UPI0019CFD7E7|nr:hypothetical protein [Vibrio kanaloae]